MLDPANLTLPYTLRIGVTGHRTLADPNGVTQAVAELLDWLNRTLTPQERAPLEWVVIAPLATGADRIVAAAVLQRPGARLKVITPVPLDHYRQGFTTAEDRAEFEALLARANPADLVELNDNASLDPTDPVQRNAGYRRAGRAVVDTCELLIAIRDGEPVTGPDGADDVIDYALARGRPVLWINPKSLAAGPRRLVRRPLHALASGTASDGGYMVTPLPTSAKRLLPGYHALAAFLGDAAIPPATYAAAARDTQDTLHRCAERTGLAPEAVMPLVERILPYYVRADQLALHYQARHVRSIKGVPLLSATAVTLAVFQVLFFPAQFALIGLEILAMLGALAWLRLHRQRAWHARWLHDRHLAEHLRTSLFALLLGEDPCKPLEQASHTLPFYTGASDGLLAALHRIVCGAGRLPAAGPFSAVKRFIIEAWLAEQRAFHRRNAERKEHMARTTRRRVTILFGTTLAAALLHLSSSGYPHAEPSLLAPGLWFTFLAIVLPAWGAAVHAVGKQLEYERIAARSEQMAQLLSHAIEQAEATSSLAELRPVVQQVTGLTGLENYEWMILLSFNPLALAG